MTPPRKILLVEDDVDDQEFFCEVLQLVKPALELEIVTNGREALKKIKERLPDFIFLDLNMQVMDGFEFLQELRSIEKYNNIPAIVLTTSDHPNDIERSKKLGAIQYFTKPTNAKTLLKDICDVVCIEPANVFLYNGKPYLK
jgi:CheY-like chemotaxis protein